MNTLRRVEDEENVRVNVMMKIMEIIENVKQSFMESIRSVRILVEKFLKF